MPIGSAFQKSIRCADPLVFKCTSKMEPDKVWNKLTIISAEDIGRAYPLICSYLKAQYEAT